MAAQVRIAVKEAKFTVNRQVAALSHANPSVSSAFLFVGGVLQNFVVIVSVIKQLRLLQDCKVTTADRSGPFQQF